MDFKPNEWFVPIVNNYPQLEQEYLRLELNKKTATKAQNMSLESINTQWLRIVQDAIAIV
ncbi:hypothetical protein GW793_00665 [bacterium]|uniref:Uncharacterized protein n=2 Tax=Katanobacteria TaxID=422282 RepID=A0A2M7X135_UNCKA|nr:hypothetical protein [bacterium]PIP56682.1 MAG: hypothetical protein COX05_01775 [candidate division WWE3 bacterium CG22_combo_CG10-13_8_21_14_all_39_12]PJA39789.1 MAG: hypothetical protein CO179_04465 [candidate division WWE3 bacterium CG_4_9_14_3_um_filter_39_7]